MDKLYHLYPIESGEGLVLQYTEHTEEDAVICKLQGKSLITYSELKLLKNYMHVDDIADALGGASMSITVTECNDEAVLRAAFTKLNLSATIFIWRA